jgi:hypothetical protein
MRVAHVLAIVVFSLPLVHGQSEAELKRAFEGKRVTVKIEMPATKWGIDLHLDQAQPIDFKQYSHRIKNFGTALRPGDSVMVTAVKVKENHIEFQLGGGGYGTLFDESPDVFVPHAGKTKRERNLEKDIDRETDPQRRRRMKDELSDLRSERDRDNQLAQAVAAGASETKRANIRQMALDSGSRFNLRFAKGQLLGGIPTPEDVRRLLAEWVEFEPVKTTAASDSRP